MLAAMTSREIGDWMAWYTVENEVTEEDERISEMGLSEQASRKLMETMRKPRGR